MEFSAIFEVAKIFFNPQRRVSPKIYDMAWRRCIRFDEHDPFCYSNEKLSLPHLLGVPISTCRFSPREHGAFWNQRNPSPPCPAPLPIHFLDIKRRNCFYVSRKRPEKTKTKGYNPTTALSQKTNSRDYLLGYTSKYLSATFNPIVLSGRAESFKFQQRQSRLFCSSLRCRYAKKDGREDIKTPHERGSEGSGTGRRRLCWLRGCCCCCCCMRKRRDTFVVNEYIYIYICGMAMAQR